MLVGRAPAGSLTLCPSWFSQEVDRTNGANPLNLPRIGDLAAPVMSRSCGNDGDQW